MSIMVQAVPRTLMVVTIGSVLTILNCGIGLRTGTRGMNVQFVESEKVSAKTKRGRTVRLGRRRLARLKRNPDQHYTYRNSGENHD